MSDRFSRRGLLRAGAMAALGATLPAQARARAATQGTGQATIRLGLASYTLRTLTRAQMIQVMQQLQLWDLNAKDVKDHLPADPTEEAAALGTYTAAGIRLHAAGAIYLDKNDEADIRSKFEYCKRAGVKVMVAGDPTLENLPIIERLVREYDIRVAIHNHGPEDKRWPAPQDVLKVVASMDPRIGCCIDVGHAARAGADVVASIEQAGPRLLNIHMKDLTDFHAKESQVAVGDGIMPVPAIFKALLAAGYSGYVDLEYEIHPEDPVPGVISSLAYMRGVLAGMKNAAAS